MKTEGATNVADLHVQVLACVREILDPGSNDDVRSRIEFESGKGGRLRREVAAEWRHLRATNDPAHPWDHLTTKEKRRRHTTACVRGAVAGMVEEWIQERRPALADLVRRLAAWASEHAEILIGDDVQIARMQPCTSWTEALVALAQHVLDAVTEHVHSTNRYLALREVDLDWEAWGKLERDLRREVAKVARARPRLAETEEDPVREWLETAFGRAAGAILLSETGARVTREIAAFNGCGGRENRWDPDGRLRPVKGTKNARLRGKAYERVTDWLEDGVKRGALERPRRGQYRLTEHAARVAVSLGPTR